MNKIVKEFSSRILRAMKYAGIDVKANQYIVEHETVISISDSPDGFAMDKIGSNMTWKHFIEREIHLALKAQRNEIIMGHKRVFPDYSDPIEMQRHKTFLALLI